MAQWRKVVVSGSSAVLNQISASGDIVPISDAGSSLGSTTREWNNLYIDGTANIDSLVADTADINGGTVDGAIIGGASAAAATITTLNITSMGSGWTNAGNTVADGGTFTTIDINGGTINGITDLAVADGGTGVSTLTDGGVLLGNGTGGIVAMSVLTDGQMIVGDGTTDPVAESGATLRTSIGVGTGDSPQFTAVNIGAASDTTLARESAGDLTVEGNHIYRVGGTDVSVADGGTGASSLTNLITLGTHTTGNYISTITPSSGIYLDGASSATSTETAIPTLSVDSGSMAAYYSSSAFSVISGDVAITSAGVATVTGATTNAALTAGAGISAGGTFDGATARTFALDINELTAEAIASTDTIAFNDATDNGQHKETIDDIATLFAGTGLTAASAVIGVDASQTQITSVGTIGTGTWQGTAVADTWVANDLTISGGTVNNSVIGGSSAAAITGTTIDATTDFTIGSTVITDDSIVMTPTTNDTATIAASTNGALAITTVDTNAAAANITITADGTFEAIGTTVTLDSGGAINLEPAGGSAILLDGTISIDGGVVTGATSITSTTGSFGRVIATTLSGDGAGITGLTSAAIDTTAGMTNNYVLTATGATAVTGEANLQFDGTDVTVAGGGKVAFRDNGGEYIYSVSDNVLGLVAGSEIDLTATTVDINGLVDISGNLTVGGDLDVNGTTTTINTANSYIADKFMIIASGSQSDTDGGIIVQNSVGAGYALGYDQGVDRWAFDADLAHNATALGPDAYVGVVQFGTDTPDTQTPTPTYGGITNGIGTIYVDTDDSEIWIYA
jgi:hypothetical protein